MPPSLEVVRTVPGINSQGGRQRFWSAGWGCLNGAKFVRRVEEELNGRFPGGGVLTLPWVKSVLEACAIIAFDQYFSFLLIRYRYIEYR